MKTYRNSFYESDKKFRQPFFKIDTKPILYKGYEIYHRIRGNNGGDIFDIVENGVCIHMYSGINGAKNKIDSLCSLRKK
jgi:hypothetical protein